MSEPVVVSFSPTANETSVVLGRVIEIVFDQPIDPATVNSSTFALMGPGQSVVLDADNLSIRQPAAVKGKEYVPGVFSFPSPERVVFTPSVPLRQKTEYSVMLAGGTTLVAVNVVKNLAGEKLARSYSWKFVTTDLDLQTPVTPPVSPLAEDNPSLPVGEIRVIPRKTIGLTATSIDIYFPDEIDLASLDAAYGGGAPDRNPFNDILVGFEAVNDDPQVKVPGDLAYTVTIEGNKLTIHLQGT